MRGDVKDSLRDFLVRSVATTDALALFALLARQASTTASSLDDLVPSTGLGRQEADPALRHLVKAGLVRETEGTGGERRFQFAPNDPDLVRLSEELLRLYEENPAAVLRVLNEGAVERLLQLARQAFSSGLTGGKKERE